MKPRSRWIGLTACASLALSVLVLTAPGARADVVSISRTFSGFEFEKPSLTTDMKNAIKAWMLSNGDFTEVSCFGYTGHNVFNRPSAFMNKLAKTRALKTCNYVKSLASSIKIASTGGVPSNSKNPNSRRVTITLSREGNSIGGGTGPGGGTGVTGTCDDNVTVKMRSRLLRGDLYFSQMNITDINAGCKGLNMDVYLVDGSGNELASAKDLAISTTSLTFGFSVLNNKDIKSTDVASVAISIR